MARRGKCCCTTECICDEVWTAFNLGSFSLFGRSWSLDFQPDVVSPGMCARHASECFNSSVSTAFDQQYESGWVVNTRTITCPICGCIQEIFGNPTRVDCPTETYRTYESRGKVFERLKAHHFTKYYVLLSALPCDTGNTTQIKFVATVFAASNRVWAYAYKGVYQYRYIDVTCPSLATTYGSWEPASPDLTMPDTPAPCNAVNNLGFEECSSDAIETIQTSPCINTNTSTTLSGSSLDQTFLPPGSEPNFDDPECKYTKEYGTWEVALTTVLSHCACFRMDPAGCQKPGVIAWVPENVSSPIHSETYVSECYDCTDIPTSVTLNRIGVGAPGSRTINMIPAEVLTCGTVPALDIVFPASISVALT